MNYLLKAYALKYCSSMHQYSEMSSQEIIGLIRDLIKSVSRSVLVLSSKLNGFSSPNGNVAYTEEVDY